MSRHFLFLLRLVKIWISMKTEKQWKNKPLTMSWKRSTKKNCKKYREALNYE